MPLVTPVSRVPPTSVKVYHVLLCPAEDTPGQSQDFRRILTIINKRKFVQFTHGHATRNRVAELATCVVPLCCVEHCSQSRSYRASLPYVALSRI